MVAGKKGYRMTEQQKRNLSLGQLNSPIVKAWKGCIPWNKGITAWNNGRRWPDEVRENISKGMVVYWVRRKNGNDSSGNNIKQK